MNSNAGLTTLTGGAGRDIFVVGTQSSGISVYTTITDFGNGDTLTLKDKGTETFSATKVTLAATATLADYANQVVVNGGDTSSNGKIGWFQFGGNTYVVQGMHDATTTASFVNGTDQIVQLTGLVDLSNVVFAAGTGGSITFG